jgi:transcriptional regulator with XRE-family HTH domain
MDLAQWMKANRYTDAKLAEEVGVSRPFLTRIRRGERQPSATILVRLVSKTNLPAETFLKAA